MSVAQELSPDDTLGILDLPGVATERTSAGLGWERMLLSVQAEQPYHAAFGGVSNHLLILHLDGPVQVSRGTGTTRQTRTIGAGGMFLHPAGRELDVELGGRLRTLHMYLDETMVADAAGRPVDLAEEIGTKDPLLEQLVLSLDTVSRSYTDSARLYVDSLGTAVAAQLAERHAAVPRQRSVPASRGLGDRELDVATELMREHLADGISLAALAGAVGLSESQFARAFKARMGVPPHRYLITVRLEHAQRLLRTTELPIADVAAASGFAGQEHLTRVMRARWDTTPAVLRTSFR
ncbi:helix-turn-helix domain-containing protein [Nocardioides mangrovicus]|uniref:Helix-turn-helix domain-containing protein n=1 Tax=Nocardioides mangrovicus TaxID=2478913 RepID=A0A3L8P6D1_9ACTN|nr:helix-turn-helix domain-containing protein [Nocardioides mangrovicus]RLV50960.1 helix-turn-helix domain-containing protein [Nocardioides mangrovicus]